MEKEPDKDFRVDLLFPDDYSDFIAEIYYKDHFLCLFSQERGLEKPEVELSSFSDVIKFPLSGFQEALDHALLRLFELRKTENT